MDKMFDFSLQRDKLYKQVADQLQHLIIAESLHPGDKLPGERELAERMGVSRTVVREAIRALSVRGLVKVRSGCGTYIQGPTSKDMAANIGLFLRLWQTPEPYRKIYEIRRMLEVEAAGLAAQRATADDHAALEAAIAGMVARQDTQGYVESDLAFHQAIATAAHNELFNVLLGPIADLLREFIVQSTRAPGSMQDGIEYHKEILRQIRGQNIGAARQAMHDHLAHAHDMVASFQKETEVGQEL